MSESVDREAPAADPQGEPENKADSERASDHERAADHRRSAEALKPRSGGVPVLSLVKPLAAMAVVAMLLGRMIGPASTGLVVGAGRLTHWIEIAGAITTQLFAIAATVVVMSEVIAVTKAKLPTPLRLGAIVVGGFGVIVGLSAAALRVPVTSAAVLGVGACVLALAAAVDAARAPFSRVFAVALALLAAAALARLASVGLADLAVDRGSLRLGDVARGVSTASFVLDAFALLIAMSIISASANASADDDGRAGALGGSSGAKKLTSPLTMVALIVAFIATRQAVMADADDASAASVLLRRAVERLLLRPDPFVPVALRIFVGFLGVIVAVLALVARGPVPALMGALALALMARGAPDMPLGALGLILAGLSMALASRDDRGVWAAIMAGARRTGDAGEPRSNSRTPA